MFLKNIRRIALVVAAMSALSFAELTVSSPSSGATVSSPVRFVASATSSNPITGMTIYVNGATAYRKYSSPIDTSLALSGGSKTVIIKAWDSKGYVQQKTFSIYVSSGSTSPSTSPSTVTTDTGTTFWDVDQMTGWTSCDRCSGPGGNGYATPHSMAQYISSPSMDGKSARFWLGGDTPYASALWWKQLGARDSARNFVMEQNFYYTDHNAIQALEFDANQSVNGWKHIFATECNQRNTGTWRVWESARTYKAGGGWRDTGVPCRIAAYKWNKVIWEFQRLDNGYVKYISVTLNGVKSYVNRVYTAEPSSVRELNVAFQMDGNGSMTDYTVWVDKISVKYW
jgi:hypothetical protein